MSKTRVLVVDNEEDQQRLMEKVLARLGFEPTVTDSPEHALAHLATGGYRIAIVDLIMPEMDGTELCEQMRQYHPDLLIYAISGHAELYKPAYLEHVGFDGLIPKPIQMKALEKILDAALSGDA